MPEPDWIELPPVLDEIDTAYPPLPAWTRQALPAGLLRTGYSRVAARVWD